MKWRLTKIRTAGRLRFAVEQRRGIFARWIIVDMFETFAEATVCFDHRVDVWRAQSWSERLHVLRSE